MPNDENDYQNPPFGTLDHYEEVQAHTLANDGCPHAD